MKYLITRFSITPNNEDTRSLIAWAVGEVGYDSFQDTDYGIDGYILQSMYDEDALNDGMESVVYDGLECHFSTEEAPDRNWNEQWEQNGFEPIVIQNKCVVHDGKHLPVDISQYKIAITIEARQAFGTGVHFTTQLMLSHLLAIDLTEKNVLDCGCGSGILSIASSKHGAARCFAYDIDEWSVRNTLHNAEINSIDNIEVAEGNAEVIADASGIYDVVLANINRNILIDDMPRYAKAMKQDGCMLLSGFYYEDIDVLEKALAKYKLCITDRAQLEDWALIKCKFED